MTQGDGVRPIRRFVLVVAFEVALLVAALLVLDRVPPLLAGVVVVAVVIETLRLRRAQASDGSASSGPSGHDAVDGPLLRGMDVAQRAGLAPTSADPRAVATAFVDIEPGWFAGHPYAIAMHDEVRSLFDEDALADEEPGAWSDEGPIGDTVRAQPEIAAVLREDREVVHVRPASADVGPGEVHAAAVRALLELHRRRPGDLADLT